MSTSRTREKADGELFKSTGIDDNATSTAVTIDANEIVTVGSTVSPALKVNRQSANGDAYIELQSNGTKVANLVGSSVGGFSVHTGASGTLTTALAIDNSGNVGIGRSSALNYNAGGTLKNLSIDAGTSTDARAEISLAGGGGGANYSLGRINFGLSSNTTNAAVGINGYSSAAGASTGGILVFSTASNISSNPYQERMRIDSAGRVTKPSQPCFHVAFTNNGHTTSSATNLVYDQVFFNVGSNYSTSTGRFTAPIAGKYVFSQQALTASATETNAWMSIDKNGTQASTKYLTHTNHSSHDHTIILSLAVNDYVQVHLGQGVIHTDSTHQKYTYFEGYLLQ